MQLDRSSKDAGGQHVARLINALPEHLRDAARTIMDAQAQRAASTSGELQELSSSLMNMLLQLMRALSPQTQGQQQDQDAGEGQDSGGAQAGGGMPGGAGGGKPASDPPSGMPQAGGGAGGEPSDAPQGDEGGKQDEAEGREETQAESQSEGASDPRQGLSELLQKLLGNQDQDGSGLPSSDSQEQDEGESESDDGGGESQPSELEEAEAAEKSEGTQYGGEPLVEEVEVPYDEGSDAQGQGEGDGEEGQGRGEGDPNAPAEPQQIAVTPEEAEAQAARDDLEAFLQVLEKVIKGRAKRPGAGKSRWVAWSPGDVFTEPDEILRYREDDAYSVPPELRRAIHRRDKKLHLVVVAIDSSGSVSNELFALLHTGMSVVADMLVEQEDVHLGVCQFSGGAQWTLPPTSDLQEIEWFSRQPAERLFHGGTTVSEVFAILGSEIAEYRSVDVVAMTDGWVEPGKELAEKVDYYSSALGCEVKVHGVVCRGRGTTREFEQAKALNPVSVRVWSVGTRPPQLDPAAQAAKQRQALKELTPEQKDKLRQQRDKK